MLEGDAAFPGDEVVLGEEFGFCVEVAAGCLDYAVQNLLTDLFDGFFARDDAARVDVNDVRHALGET